MGRILSDGRRGHNGGVTQSVFLKHKGKYDSLSSRKSKLASDEKQFWKDADDDGITKGDFKWALKQESLTAAERAASHNNRRAYLKFLGHGELSEAMVEVDENAFDEVGKTPEEREAHWRDHGKRHGLEGKGLDVAMGKHTTDSEAGQWIQQGWAEGQAELAKGIKPKPADETAKGKRGAGKTSSDAEAGKLSGGVQPQPEPEAAKARGRKGGVSYRHDPEKRKVYEISIADAIPEGSVNITRPEYDKLKSQYAAEEEEAWQQTAPTGDGEQPPTPGDDGFDDPPTPEAA